MNEFYYEILFLRSIRLGFEKSLSINQIIIIKIKVVQISIQIINNNFFFILVNYFFNSERIYRFCTDVAYRNIRLDFEKTPSINRIIIIGNSNLNSNN